jgi:hypothetical protein
MTILESALQAVGVDSQSFGPDLTVAIDEFTQQASTFNSIADLTSAILETTNALPNNQISQQVSGITGGNGSGGSAGSSGDFEHVHYATDLIPHQPKFKFLFKVKFEGFPGGTFYYYVHRCDKPKIQFNHVDVNYYNFRTKVLTHTTFLPMTIEFLDEIGNTTNTFFTEYLKQRSGQGKGNWGINKGFQDASSSIPYETGYSKGTQIVIEQIFANGTKSNRFKFKNPRIESMEFDSMAMDDNGVNYFTIMFDYDAIECETVSTSTIHTWGQTDIHHGGGMSGNNGGAHGGGSLAQTSITGTGGIGGANNGIDIAFDPSSINSQLSLPKALQGIPGFENFDPFSLSFGQSSYSSSQDILSSDISQSISSIQSGQNLNVDAAIDPSEFRN